MDSICLKGIKYSSATALRYGFLAVPGYYSRLHDIEFWVDYNSCLPEDRASFFLIRSASPEKTFCIGGVDPAPDGTWVVKIFQEFTPEGGDFRVIDIHPYRSSAIECLWHHRYEYKPTEGWWDN